MTPQIVLMNDKKTWLKSTDLKSKAGKWEVVRIPDKKTITLTYIHDSQRMMRNSISMTYAEFEDLSQFIKDIC